MTSHYTNTIAITYIFLCVFIKSATSHSFIRQFTDDFNTNLHQEAEAELIKNLDFTHENHEISSLDHKLSASNTLKGFRERPPSSYSLKMESFKTLINEDQKYFSRPFVVGGYNWTLVVYAYGNENDNRTRGYISLYVTIDISSLTAGQEMHADLRFYIFNKNEKKYFTVQDTDVWKFSKSKMMWGFSQVISVDTFKDPKNGYLYDGDHCEFGVDVITPSLFDKSEIFTITEGFSNETFTWRILKFSTLLKDSYTSDTFTIGGNNWYLRVYPNGVSAYKGEALSVFFLINDILKPYERIYVRVRVRVLSRIQNVEKTLTEWYRTNYGFGFHNFMSLSDLKDPSKGFLVNDALTLQAEIDPFFNQVPSLVLTCITMLLFLLKLVMRMNCVLCSE